MKRKACLVLLLVVLMLMPYTALAEEDPTGLEGSAPTGTKLFEEAMSIPYRPIWILNSPLRLHTLWRAMEYPIIPKLIRQFCRRRWW